MASLTSVDFDEMLRITPMGHYVFQHNYNLSVDVRAACFAEAYRREHMNDVLPASAMRPLIPFQDVVVPLVDDFDSPSVHPDNSDSAFFGESSPSQFAVAEWPEPKHDMFRYGHEQEDYGIRGEIVIVAPEWPELGHDAHFVHHEQEDYGIGNKANKGPMRSRRVRPVVEKKKKKEDVITFPPTFEAFSDRRLPAVRGIPFRHQSMVEIISIGGFGACTVNLCDPQRIFGDVCPSCPDFERWALLYRSYCVTDFNVNVRCTSSNPHAGTAFIYSTYRPHEAENLAASSMGSATRSSIVPSNGSSYVFLKGNMAAIRGWSPGPLSKAGGSVDGSRRPTDPLYAIVGCNTFGLGAKRPFVCLITVDLFVWFADRLPPLLPEVVVPRFVRESSFIVSQGGNNSGINKEYSSLVPSVSGSSTEDFRMDHGASVESMDYHSDEDGMQSGSESNHSQ